MSGPTKADNDEERIARITRMVEDLARVEQTAQQLAAEVREKAAKITAELAALKKSADPLR